MGPEARANLSKARRIIVKLGTRALMGDDRDIDRAALSRRLEELLRARKEGRLVVLVSSGAIGLGWTRLGFSKRPVTMPELQASASVGQSYLMKIYNELLAPMKLQAGQLLLTHEDFRDRRRYLNLRNCLVALHEAGALPVINENDSVSVDEIRFGDNDILAGLLSNAIDADLTVLFSDVDGVYDGDTKLDIVEEVDGGLDRLVKKSTSGFGSGGMASKLSAARTTTASPTSKSPSQPVMPAGSSDLPLCRIAVSAPASTLSAPASLVEKAIHRFRCSIRSFEGRNRVPTGLPARMSSSVSVLPCATTI
ncbi:MAG TPA: glutamate 5-kinase, partial [Planctomycetota bacterium]|nr:glutamate 5-kinase [Planctomycetota bacterium]